MVMQPLIAWTNVLSMTTKREPEFAGVASRMLIPMVMAPQTVLTDAQRLKICSLGLTK
jgi:hypothetical protein